MPEILTVLATDGSGLDQTLVTELLNLVKTMMSLFKEFPLNILLVSSLACVGFGIFAVARRAAAGR